MKSKIYHSEALKGREQSAKQQSHYLSILDSSSRAGPPRVYLIIL
jgi:hypothetical protein